MGISRPENNPKKRRNLQRIADCGEYYKLERDAAFTYVDFSAEVNGYEFFVFVDDSGKLQNKPPFSTFEYLGEQELVTFSFMNILTSF